MLSDRFESRWLIKVAIEVVLITAGVFLALVGEQWRQDATTRELAETSLRRFKAEIQTNRNAVVAMTPYHADIKKQLEAFLASDQPKTPENFKVDTPNSLGPIFFEESAWELAIATQSMAYIDADVAFALSRAYSIQRSYSGIQWAIVNSTVYGRSMGQDFEGYWRSVSSFLGDVTAFDPLLTKAYDDALPLIDRALGE